MEEFSENKFQTMVDEMTRFEEEIGLPYIPDIDNPHIIVSQPFVIGTNTFSQAQQKILEINHHTPDGIPAESTMFVPHQVLHRSQTNTVPGGIPPPPPPPLSMPPAGMTFPPKIPISYSQPIPPPPQPPNFGTPMIIRTEGISAPPNVLAASSISFPRRTPPTWPSRTTFRPPVTTKSETPKPTDQPPKVVVSATPKLYTSKFDQNEDNEMSNLSNCRMSAVECMKSMNYSDTRFMNKKPKIEPTKYIPASTSTLDPFSQSTNKKKDKKQKKCIRVSGGQTWEDSTLAEWEDGDFRLFCGDLGNDVTDELLTRIFSKYPSFLKARVVRDKRTNKTKGFGFISFKDPQDFIKASKEMNGRYVGSRPIKLRKSTWKNRNMDTVKKKEKEKAALIALLTGKQ